MSSPPAVLEYASARTVGSVDPAMLPVSRYTFGTAVLSGPAVGSCFLLFMEEAWTILPHLGVYILLLYFCVRAGMALRALAAPAWWMICDGAAAAGLVGIGVSPLVYYGAGENPSKWMITALAGCYLLLAVSAWRAAPFYRRLAAWTRPYARRLAAVQVALGWLKALYETVWLGCCATLLFGVAIEHRLPDSDLLTGVAFTALFGTLGFGAVWLAMMVIHFLWWRRVASLLKMQG